MNTSASHDDVIRRITEVNQRSATAQVIDIFELGSLSDLIPFEAAEEIRERLQENRTYVRQLTNASKFEAWTENSDLAKRQHIKYIHPDRFTIANEILVFDDTVATYRLKPSPFYEEITDASYAGMMRGLFSNLWNSANSLLLSDDGSTLSKQYLPLNLEFNQIPVVIYPAKDDGRLEKAFDRHRPGSIETYVERVLQQDPPFIEGADMVIGVVWNQDAVPYCDIWKVQRNTYSDDSGLLYDVRIYKEFDQITNMGVASGNTSIVLTAEEMLLRKLVLTGGSSFSEAANRKRYQPHFPIGYFPDESFYVTPVRV